MAVSSSWEKPEEVRMTRPRALIAMSSILSLSEKFSMVLRISEEKLVSASCA